MQKLFAKILAKPITVILLCLTICCLSAAGLSGLRLNASYNAYFDEQDPILGTHRALQADFSISDGLVFVLDFGQPIALSDSAIAVLERVNTELKQLDYVANVTSVLDLRASEDEGFDDMDAEILGLEDNFASTQQAPTISAETVRADPRGYGLLLSKDETALAVELSVSLPQNIPAPRLLNTTAEIRESVQRAIAESPLMVNVHYSGPLALNEAYISVIRHDLKLFLPALVLSLGLMLTLIFGSIKISAAASLVAALSVVSAFGVGGWLGFELAAIDAFAPVIIASIALAGTVHILNGYSQSLDAGAGREQALMATLTENALPLALTTATTIGGFLALTFSPSPPIRTIGYLVATGVFFAWLYIMLILPALLKETSAQPKQARWLGVAITMVLNASSRSPVLILALGAVAVLAAIQLVAQNQINDNVFEYFPRSHQFRQDAEVLESKFSGVNPLIYAISTTKPMGALDDEVMQTTYQFQQWLDRQNEVRKTLAITNFSTVQDHLAQVDSNSVSRYRELAKIHTPTGLGIEKLVDPNYRALAVYVYIEPLDARGHINFDKNVKHWFEENHRSPDLKISSGGTSLVFAHLGQRNARSMVYALVIALCASSLICIFILQSFHGAWIGILCNLSPLLIVYALWALIDGNISIGGAVVIGMILGIVVDDTLYLLARFRRAKHANDTAPARVCIESVGPALIVTSVTIIVGLAAGLLSDFAPIRAMSGLSMGVIAVAVIIDLLVLSIVLRWLFSRKTKLRNSR